MNEPLNHRSLADLRNACHVMNADGGVRLVAIVNLLREECDMGWNDVANCLTKFYAAEIARALRDAGADNDDVAEALAYIGVAREGIATALEYVAALTLADALAIAKEYA